MYRRIYQTLEENGTVRIAAIVSGPDLGRRCLIREGGCVDLNGPGEKSNGDSYKNHAGSPDGTDGRQGLSMPEGTERSFWKPYEDALMEIAETALVEVNGVRLFAEVFQKNPRLVILGGGHVSCPTAKIGKMLGFHVTVMDDRDEFLTRERFPDADCLIRGSFDRLSDKIPPYENAYYVVVTRGHAGDSVCARQILRRPYTYLGMIGSKTKVRLTRETLLGEGFTPEQLDTIHAPIGIPLGGQMPAEIAVSILAQIVQVKNSRKSSFIDEEIEKRVLAGAHGVMCTIVEKNGSSPRDAGSRMFAEPDGRLTGSIGGGAVEFAAAGHCADVKRAEVVSYDLSNGEQGKLGMICGGRVTILFERI